MDQDQWAAEEAKRALRDELISARRRREPAALHAAAEAFAAHLLQVDEVRRAATVTAYLAVGSEPGTEPLVQALHAAGKRVLLPITVGSRGQGDLDLDWADYAGPASIAPARFGLQEPTTARLGVHGVAQADVVLVPGMAVSGEGARIGKGGGCYDRALARVPEDRWRCVLLFEDEVGRDVPFDVHDQPVHAACTPAGVTRFRRPDPPAAPTSSAPA